jgi:hypothetical protein
VGGTKHFVVGNPEGKDHLKDTGLDGRIILKGNLKGTQWRAVNWIDLA